MENIIVGKTGKYMFMFLFLINVTSSQVKNLPSISSYSYVFLNHRIARLKLCYNSYIKYIGKYILVFLRNIKGIMTWSYGNLP